MDIKILNDEMFAVIDDNGVQVGQKPIPDALKSLPDFKLRAALRELEQMPPVEVAAPLPPTEAPVQVAYHVHPEHLPAHGHPLLEHSHDYLSELPPHEHGRALDSEAIVNRGIAKLEVAVERIDREASRHSHPLETHSHPHSHEDVLKTIAGVSETVAEISRGHSHSEIFVAIGNAETAISAVDAKIGTHSHPQAPLPAHSHPELDAAFKLEAEARIAGDAAPREVPAHQHPHNHAAETEALKEQVKAEALALVNSTLSKASFGSTEEVQAIKEGLARHQHPHVHEDFLNEVKAVRDKFSEFARHGHDDVSAALENANRRLTIQEAHVHDEVPAHSHSEVAGLREEVADLRATVINLGRLISEQATQIAAMSDRITNSGIDQIAALQNAVTSLQPKGEYVTREELTNRKAQYNLLRESHEDRAGKHVVIVTLEEVT